MIMLYLRDRFTYILLFIINTLFIITTSLLAFSNTGVRLEAGTILYLFVLTFFFLAIWMVVDFFRRRPLLKRLMSLNQEPAAPLETAYELEALTLPSAEAKLWVKLVRNYHQQYTDELESYKNAQKQHHLFINQWVHHMKTPMSVISLLVQQGRTQFEDADMKQLLDEVNDENDRFRHGLD